MSDTRFVKQNTMPKILLIIPAYNEAESIERVVKNIEENFPQYDYVVVNDGSKDSTAQICRENGFHLIDLPINLGLSGAFQSGMLYASRKGYDYAIQYDGDGQHNPEYISKMVEEANRNHWQITIGSRYASERKPWTLRMAGSRVIQLCIKLTTGKTINDPTSGMRLYSKSLIRVLAEMMNCSPEPDTVAFLIRCGVNVGEVQVTMNEREAGESYLKFMNTVKYMLNVCLSILVAQWFRKKIGTEVK